MTATMRRCDREWDDREINRELGEEQKRDLGEKQKRDRKNILEKGLKYTSVSRA